MPATYSIDSERKVVISRAWGVMTSADVRGHRRALRSDPLFDRTYRELVDMSGITEDLVDLGAKKEISQDQATLFLQPLVGSDKLDIADEMALHRFLELRLGGVL